MSAETEAYDLAMKHGAVVFKGDALHTVLTVTPTVLANIVAQARAEAGQEAAAVQAVGAWQDIATAPKDGVLTLFCDQKAEALKDTFFVDWMVNGRFCMDRKRKATHWRPLPDWPASPPTSTEGRTP